MAVAPLHVDARLPLLLDAGVLADDPDRVQRLASLLSSVTMRTLSAADVRHLVAFADQDPEGLDWRLLESYARVGATYDEAILAVAGDRLQLAIETEGSPTEARESAERLLDHLGLTVEQVRDALGLDRGVR